MLFLVYVVSTLFMWIGIVWLRNTRRFTQEFGAIVLIVLSVAIAGATRCETARQSERDIIFGAIQQLQPSEDEGE